MGMTVSAAAEAAGVSAKAVRLWEDKGLVTPAPRTDAGYRQYTEDDLGVLRFIRQAKARRRDYTVDWVHLKLNDQAQRTVLCKDPFRHEDERVDKLIASM